jgi:hypothetical protein
MTLRTALSALRLAISQMQVTRDTTSTWLATASLFLQICWAMPGRNSLVGPGLAELDYSVSGDFPMRFISEAARLQFRAEMFNLANRANFEPPLPNNQLYNAKGAALSTAGLRYLRDCRS